jgi:hypothetical protein
MDYEQRNNSHRGELKKAPHHLSLRPFRPLSWLHRTESCERHLSGQLVLFLFVFNVPNLREKGREKGREKSHETKRQANMALAKQHIAKILEFAVPRLYNLRKHIIHIEASSQQRKPKSTK